jgi:hypothetical protein
VSMANYRGAVSSRSAHDASIVAVAAKRGKRKAEPDLDLIKQVEQVTISALKGPAWRFAGIPSTGITDAVNVLVFPIWQLLSWLLFGCRNSQQRPSATCLRRGNATGPTRRFQEPGHMGCRAVALPNSVRLIHNRGNLACCPDFNVRRYFLGDFVVAPMPDALPSADWFGAKRHRASARRGLRVTVIISAVPSGGELTG